MVQHVFIPSVVDIVFICSSSREKEDRKAIKKEDFILDKLKDETIYRLPGSINGQQFIGKIDKREKYKLCDFLNLFILIFLVQNCDVSYYDDTCGKIDYFYL